MISDELLQATQRLWNEVGNNPTDAWAPWISVNTEVGHTMISLMENLLSQS
jgi:hypothetical protein